MELKSIKSKFQLKAEKYFISVYETFSFHSIIQNWPIKAYEKFALDLCRYASDIIKSSTTVVHLKRGVVQPSLEIKFDLVMQDFITGQNNHENFPSSNFEIDFAA